MHCGKVCRSYVLICTGSVIVNTISHLFYCMQVRLIAMNELWSGRLRGVQGADLLCQVRHIHFLFPFQILMCLLLFNTFVLLYFSKISLGKLHWCSIITSESVFT